MVFWLQKMTRAFILYSIKDTDSCWRYNILVGLWKEAITELRYHGKQKCGLSGLVLAHFEYLVIVIQQAMVKKHVMTKP